MDFVTMALKGHCHLQVWFFCWMSNPQKKYYRWYVISYTCAVIELSHNLATYEVAWKKASYWYELVEPLELVHRLLW